MTSKQRAFANEAFRTGELIDLAMKRAAEEARRQHRMLGVNVPSWKDGKIIWVSPDGEEFPDEAGGPTAR